MATIIDPKTKQTLQDAIINLYLNIKIRNNEEVYAVAIMGQIANFTEEKYAEERAKLNDVDLFTVLDYIRSTVEILMNLKSEEAAEPHSVAPGSESGGELGPAEQAKEYELMIQKLEEEARNHVRVEQQLKLHLESLQFKLDDLERLKEENGVLIKSLNEVLLRSAINRNRK